MNRQKKKQFITEKAVFGQWVADSSEKVLELVAH